MHWQSSFVQGFSFETYYFMAWEAIRCMYINDECHSVENSAVFRSVYVCVRVFAEIAMFIQRYYSVEQLC